MTDIPAPTRAFLRSKASHPGALVVEIAAGDLLALLDATEWRSIETAPKDGNRVHLWWDRWADFPIDGRFINGEWVSLHAISTDAGDNGPTHWRPLPAPPQGGEPSADDGHPDEAKEWTDYDQDC